MFELRQLMLVNIMIRVKMVEFAFPQMEDQFVNAATLTLMASTADKVSCVYFSDGIWYTLMYNLKIRIFFMAQKR